MNNVSDGVTLSYMAWILDDIDLTLGIVGVVVHSALVVVISTNRRRHAFAPSVFGLGECHHRRIRGMVLWGGTMKYRPDKISGPTRYNLGKK